MTRLLLSLAVLLGFAVWDAPGEAAPPAVGELVKTELAAETASLAPGKTAWFDVHLVVAPGWHIYWRNPGDAGLPTAIAWTLPPGFAAGAIEWPIPERFKVGDIANYGYTGAVDLLVPIAVPVSVGDAAARAGAARTPRSIFSFAPRSAVPATRSSG